MAAANFGNLSKDIGTAKAATTDYLASKMTPGSALYKATNWVDTPAGQNAVKAANNVLTGVQQAAPAAGALTNVAKDVATANFGNLSKDIGTAKAATTDYLASKMTPGSALYKATDWLDTSAGQNAVKAANTVLTGVQQAAPAAGALTNVAKDVATGNFGNLRQDIGTAKAATTDYLASKMTPGSALYKATDWVDTRAGQYAVKAANSVLTGVQQAAPAAGAVSIVVKDVNSLKSIAW